ncbi:hypothetical protein J5N97_002437 [Dioscorea zingiberensis]|uniref:FAS1 domain-containing protein n=1 Tax=Dioscorea zingiberensis TaxID=325984 RepID=A0A9D5D280_9LILI|nr:hypothetical protein J5N97_002437 [Dioscorea zingiberensis]
MEDLKLSVSDLPMLSCHYIQKGLLFSQPPLPISILLSLLSHSLSRALTLFPALAGRLTTRSDHRIFITCNDAGTDFIHAMAPTLTIADLLPACSSSDVPKSFKDFFTLDYTLSYHGHFQPLSAFQVTELGDGGLFIGCTVNHAIVDGTSFWNFFNSWAELCRNGGVTVSRTPDFRRNYFGDSEAVLRFPDSTGPKITFSVDDPIRERIFHFSREAIAKLKAKANNHHTSFKQASNGAMAEMYGKQVHDRKVDEISSFQSLSALLWMSVTRARARSKRLTTESSTTFRMAVNCRHRLVPAVDAYYFGNAIQSIPTTASVGDVVAKGLKWAAGQLHKNVLAYNDERVRKGAAEWEAAPRCFPLGNPDGAGITMGSSPRFPMYDNDFGWGRPLAVRSGRANKFDGKLSAFPGRDGDGSVDLEVCLAPETMAGILEDDEFMHLPDVSQVMSGRRTTGEEVSLGLLGDMMVGMLPGDLAFTVFVPSEAAFESILKLRATDGLVKDKINNTYAVLSCVMGFSAVPQHLSSVAVPFNGEISLYSVSGFRLHAWRSSDGALLVNNVSSERVDLRKDEIIVHVMRGVLMDAEFEQSFSSPDYED